MNLLIQKFFFFSNVRDPGGIVVWHMGFSEVGAAAFYILGSLSVVSLVVAIGKGLLQPCALFILCLIFLDLVYRF